MRVRETINELLNAKEGESYQFKEWKTKDDLREAAKICCALANCGGKHPIGGQSVSNRRSIGGERR